MYENAASEARVSKFLYSGFIQVNLYNIYICVYIYIYSVLI